MIHLDPDFKTLTFSQRETALRSLYLVTMHGDRDRPSGVTQLSLVHAIGSALLGIDINESDINLDTSILIELKNQFVSVDKIVRERLFQLFTLTELILDVESSVL